MINAAKEGGYGYRNMSPGATGAEPIGTIQSQRPPSIVLNNMEPIQETSSL